MYSKYNNDFGLESFDDEVPEVKISPTSAKKFSTQANIVEQLKKDGYYSQTEGICSALANEYAKYKIDAKKDSRFMEGEPQEIYENAIKIKRYQEDLQQQRKNALNTSNIEFKNDGLHIGFKNVPYQEEVLEAKEIKTLADLTSHIGDKNHTLLTYPIEKDSHQVYIGKESTDSKESCVSFNANDEGGERFSSCAAIHERFFKEIKNNTKLPADQQRHVIIATSNVPVVSRSNRSQN